MRKLNRCNASVLALLALAAAACTGVIGSSDVGSSGFAPDPGGVGGGAVSGAASVGGSGSVGGGAGGTGGSAGTGASGTPVQADGGAGDPNAAGVMILRHLSQFEYLNTVRDLLSDTSLSPTQVPGEPLVPRVPGGLPQTGLVDTNTAQTYQTAAEQLATNALAKVSALLPCKPPTSLTGGAGDACASEFIAQFGLKAYRRPPNSAEVAKLLAIYHAGLAAPLNLDFNGAVDLVIEEILQSPGFLYHWEVGPSPTVHEGSVVMLDGYAVANRLSYFLWGTMPDATLLSAAGQNQLGTADAIATQASRMLMDPKARGAAANFFEAWLGVRALSSTPKDAMIYPNYGPALQSEMDTEFQDFITGVIFDRTGTLSELLTSTGTEADKDLASIYGLTNVSSATMQPVTLDSSKRSGLLTSAAFLTYNGDPDTSNPVHRGYSIYTQFLCGTIPPPPNNVPPPAPATSTGTTRDHFRAHDTLACATACHSLMDPFGYTFEHYDGLGQYRTTDNGLAVDSTSTVTVDGASHSLTDALGLTQLLAQSTQVEQCFAKQWLRFTMGRLDTADDAASLASIETAFKASKLDVREMLIAMASSRTFRYRTPSAGEVLP